MGDYVMDMLISLPGHGYFLHKWHLFRPLPELIDQGWQCMTCGTWHVASMASTLHHGRQKSPLFSWAEKAVAEPWCDGDLSYLTELLNSVQSQLSQKLVAPSIHDFHHVSLLNIKHSWCSLQFEVGMCCLQPNAGAPGVNWSRTLI